MLAQSQELKHVGIAVNNTAERDDYKHEYMNTHVYMYIYISRLIQLTGRQGKCRRVFSHTHTRRTRWRLCRKHTGILRSRVSLSNLHIMAMENDREEELGPSPAALHPSPKLLYLSSLSLSFIAQGGRSLSPVTSCLFSVPMDKDTPRFLP